MAVSAAAIFGFWGQALTFSPFSVLGLDNADSARKLVRLLLADPLSQRESWEDILEDYDADPLRGLLIRYGEITSKA
jgi:hypothetical protein